MRKRKCKTKRTTETVFFLSTFNLQDGRGEKYKSNRHHKEKKRYDREETQLSEIMVIRKLEVGTELREE